LGFGRCVKRVGFYRYVQLQGENLGVFLPFRRFLFFLENLMDFFKKSDIIIDW